MTKLIRKKYRSSFGLCLIGILGFLFIFYFSGCSRQGGSSEITPTQQEGLISPSSSLQATQDYTGITGTISEIENLVDAAPFPNSAWQEASINLTIYPNGKVRTGDDSRALLDMEDGTLIRIAPNTVFTFKERNPDPKNPFTRVHIEFGKIWVMLAGGSMEVETPNGVASVRGSELGVSYNFETKEFEATCLSTNEACVIGSGTAQVTLTYGQKAIIVDFNQPPQSDYMTNEEIAEWVEQNPEVIKVVATMTNLPIQPLNTPVFATATPSITPSLTPSSTPTVVSPTPSIPTMTLQPSPTFSPTPTKSITPTIIAVKSPTPTSRVTPTKTLTPTSIRVVTKSPTPKPKTPTPKPITPTNPPPQPSNTPTPQPSATPKPKTPTPKPITPTNPPPQPTSTPPPPQPTATPVPPTNPPPQPTDTPVPPTNPPPQPTETPAANGRTSTNKSTVN